MSIQLPSAQNCGYKRQQLRRLCDNMRCAGSFQFGTVAESPQYTDGSQPRAFSGLYVYGSVSDLEAFFFFEM